MRIIKLGIISIVFLFGLVTAMSLFIPSHVRISRATNLAPTAGYIIQKLQILPTGTNGIPGLWIHQDYSRITS